MDVITRRRFATLAAGAGFAACIGKPFASSLAHAAALQRRAVGYVYDERFSQFGINGGDYPDRVVWINRAIEQSGLLQDLFSPAPEENYAASIEAVHKDAHIRGIKNRAASSDYTYSREEVAELAVAAVLGAVRDVCDNRLQSAFCNIRPPGHHVVDDTHCIGYCCYGNVAIAAHYAQKVMGIGRVLIVDWDFHQGNGTHSLICGNDDILFFETFSPFMYDTFCNDLHPLTPAEAVPANARRINVQMPAYASNDDFEKVFREKLVPAADAFKPELVLISCGFDLKLNDSHGNFEVTASGVSRLTRVLMDIAEAHARGRIVSVLEGGYEDVPRNAGVPGSGMTSSGLAECARAHVATLMSGTVQAELPYFQSVGVAQGPGRPALDQTIARDGVLPFAGFGHTLRVFDGLGRQVLSVPRTESEWCDLKRYGLAPGRYIATLTKKSGKLSRPYVVVVP